jgi:hypothetical protein
MGVFILFVGIFLFFILLPYFVVRCFWQILHLGRLCDFLRLKRGAIAIVLYCLTVWGWWVHFQAPPAGAQAGSYLDLHRAVCADPVNRSATGCWGYTSPAR